MGLLPEHQRICHLCREIKSVAEVSALLSMPLGVTRILLADLAEAGLVAIHQPGGDDNATGAPDVTLVERVLSGLRALDGPRTPRPRGTNPASPADMERRLKDDQQAIVDCLGEILNTEEGLREVLLQARYDTVVEDLDEVLDVEAGLFDVLGRQSDPEA